jgi:hypothetical protein
MGRLPDLDADGNAASTLRWICIEAREITIYAQSDESGVTPSLHRGHGETSLRVERAIALTALALDGHRRRQTAQFAQR